jgi:DNA (cytosine-5)-methyltransferase 1
LAWVDFILSPALELGRATVQTMTSNQKFRARPEPAFWLLKSPKKRIGRTIVSGSVLSKYKNNYRPRVSEGTLSRMRAQVGQNAKAQPELLSLFCGSGGLDYGFWRAGFKTVLALDKCSEAVDTFNLNCGHKVAQEIDLAKITPDKFLSLIPANARPVGLIGGPPCQGFSRGNVCANPADPRNRLPFRYADLLAAANKKHKLHFFVFENVVELTGPKHVGRFKRILKRLTSAGFNVFWSELNASDFSVPQRRRRLFIVGLNSKLYPGVKFQFPVGAGVRRTIFDAIANLPEPQFFDRSLTPETIPYHPNHWTMVPKSAKFATGQFAGGRSFKLLDWNDVSPTVAYGNREIHVHPNGDRRLSVLEAMLLQGFPSNYTLTGTLSSQVTQISNAVPPPLAKAIATSIMSLLKSQTRAASKPKAAKTGVLS